MREKRFAKRLFVLTLSVILVLSASIPVLGATKNLTDIAGNPYEKIIKEWFSDGYIKGNPDGTFRPNSPISRVEFMALVNRALNLTETAEIKFSDVKKTDWFYKDVAIAVKAGYMKGFDGKIYPNDNVSRQELAVIVARLCDFDTKVDTKVLNKLKDAKSIPEWSKGAICAVLSHNLFGGFVTTEFMATQSISRVEAVVALDTSDTLVAFIPQEQAAAGAAKIPTPTPTPRPTATPTPTPTSVPTAPSGGSITPTPTATPTPTPTPATPTPTPTPAPTPAPTITITNVNIININTVTLNSDTSGATIKWNGTALSSKTVIGENTIRVPLLESGANNSLVVEKSGYTAYSNTALVWNDPLTYLVSPLGSWVNDRTEPGSWEVNNSWITYSTKTTPANQWYAWHGKKTMTNNALTDSWKVETEFDLTDQLLARDHVRTSMWLNVQNEIGETVDWSILQFKIEGSKKGWQYWDESGEGTWVDISADLPTTAGEYKLAIYYTDGKVIGYINGIEVFNYAKSPSKLTSVKEVIFNSYSYGESYSVRWKVPTVSYVDKYPVGTKIISTDAQLSAAIAAQANGQIWTIKAGTYDINSGFSITKNISIIGSGEVKLVADKAPTKQSVNSAPKGENPIIFIDNANVSMKNITVQSAGLHAYTPVDGITARGNSTVSLEGVTVTDIMNTEGYNGMQYGRGYTGDTGTKTTIKNCTFNNFNKNGVHFYGASTTGSVENSTFTGTYKTAGSAAQNGVVFQEGAKGSVTGSSFHSLWYAGPDTEATGIYAYGNGSEVTAANNTFANVQIPFIGENGGIVTASGSSVLRNVSTAEEFSSLLAASNNGDTIALAAGIYEFAKQLKITKPITIIGNGAVTIKAASAFNEGTQSSDKHLISINGVKGLVRMENLTFCNAKRSGINVWESDNVVLKDITSKENTGAGLVVCNSTVVADSFNTSGNGWGYGVNVDNGSNPSAGAPATSFVLNSGKIEEPKQIVSDKGGVTIAAPNYSVYINDASMVSGANITGWYGEGNSLLDTSVNINFDKIKITDIDSIKFSLYNNGSLLGTRTSNSSIPSTSPAGASYLVTLFRDCAQYWGKTADTYTDVTGIRILSCAFKKRDNEDDNGYWVSSACSANSPVVPNSLVVEVNIDNVTYVTTYTRK